MTISAIPAITQCATCAVSTSVNWTAYVTALSLPFVAAFGAYIAYQQWTTARNKLRFDLFEKRFAIYEGARKFLGSVITSGKANEADLSKYLIATQAAKWIVALEVHDYLDREIYNPALKLQNLEAEWEGITDVGERKNNCEQRAALRKHFYKQYETLDIWFKATLIKSTNYIGCV